MPIKPKPRRNREKPRPRPNRELGGAERSNREKKSARSSKLGDSKNRARDTIIGRANEQKRRRYVERLQELELKSIEDNLYRESQKATGKDRYEVQRGRRTKKYPKGRGI